MSPEERAKAVVDTFLRESNPETTTRSENGWDIMALIASAIREACNEKLEEAARMMDDGPLDTKKFMRGEIAPAEFEEIAERIREFKDTTP